MKEVGHLFLKVLRIAWIFSLGFTAGVVAMCHAFYTNGLMGLLPTVALYVGQSVIS